MLEQKVDPRSTIRLIRTDLDLYPDGRVCTIDDEIGLRVSRLDRGKTVLYVVSPGSVKVLQEKNIEKWLQSEPNTRITENLRMMYFNIHRNPGYANVYIGSDLKVSMIGDPLNPNFTLDSSRLVRVARWHPNTDMFELLENLKHH